MVSARIAEMVLRDERSVIPIGCYSERYGVTLSLPAVVGRGGVAATLAPTLAPQEEKALQQSADTLRRAVAQIG